MAVRVDDKINYGFSLLNTTSDKWDKKIGMSIAINRATSDFYMLPGVDSREKLVLDAFSRLEQSAIKYFKDLNYEDVALAGHLGLEDVNV